MEDAGGPGAEEAEERRRRTLAGRARQAAGDRAKIEAFIDGTGPDPEGGMKVYGPARTEAPTPITEAPKPAPAKAKPQDRSQLELAIKAARARLRAMKKRGRK